MDIPNIIYLAIRTGDVSTVREWGALNSEFIDERDEDGNSLLLIATNYNQLDMVRALRELGADINLLNNDNKTPLLIASENGSFDMVRLLVSLGAELNDPNNRVLDPLIEAIDVGNLAMVRLLVNLGAKINNKIAGGWMALSFAIYRNNLEIISALIDLGADVDAQNDRDLNIMEHAIIYNNFEAVKLLLNHGVDVNAIRTFGFTYLESAIVEGHVEIAELLLQRGADFRDLYSYGRTVIEFAAQRVKEESMVANEAGTELDENIEIRINNINTIIEKIIQHVIQIAVNDPNMINWLLAQIMSIEAEYDKEVISLFKGKILVETGLMNFMCKVLQFSHNDSLEELQKSAALSNVNFDQFNQLLDLYKNNNFLVLNKVKKSNDSDLGNFSVLPPEIINHIFSFLELSDIPKESAPTDDELMLLVIKSLSRENFENIFNHFLKLAPSFTFKSEESNDLTTFSMDGHELANPDQSAEFAGDTQE